MKLTVSDRQHEVVFEGDHVSVDGRDFTVAVAGEGRARTVHVDGRPYRVELPEVVEPSLTVIVEGAEYPVVVEALRRAGRPAPPPPPRLVAASAPGAVVARMAGRVLRVDVSVGDEVQDGALLVILEAMKMENEIRASHSGRVVEVGVSSGQRVVEGDTLVVIAIGASAASQLY